ncbi:hypothetical protein JW890_07805 [candidate division WOR-3 bacterium]|nr:hypothetical protein [candidate division WOR-3 bacterium]
MKIFVMALLAVFFSTVLFSAWEDGDPDSPILQISNKAPENNFSALDADSLYWQVLTNMPEGRCGVFTGYYRSENGETLHVHVFGGNAAPCTPHYIFDVVTNSWSAGTPLPVEMRYGASATYESNIYMFGSYLGLGTCVIYSIKADAYSYGATMPTPLNDANIALAEDRGLIYLIGGGSGWTANNVVQVYDIAGDSYFYATSIPEGVMCGASGYLGNDTLILATGYTSSAQWSASVYKGYIDPANPANITWTADGNIPGVGRRRCGYASHGDKLYVIAGQDGSYGYLNSCYMYQSDSGWVQIQDKPTYSMNHTCLTMPVTLVDADEIMLFSMAGYLNSVYMPYCEVLHTGVILSVEEPVLPVTEGFYCSLVSGNIGNGPVVINFVLAQNSDVRFSVYDITGREVKTSLFSGVLQGSHNLTWEKTDNNSEKLPSGTYFFILSACCESYRGKLVFAE